MDKSQSLTEQKAKSKGEKPANDEESAAELHAADRAEGGFSLDQVMAEFRALRASIIQLWIKQRGPADSQDIDDLTRFNESIDQALSESLVRFNQDLEESREIFLGILGHDLRTPLQAIRGAGELLAMTKSIEKNAVLSSMIVASADRINHLIIDLLELTRVKLGGGISVERTQVDVGQICMEALAELKTIYPRHVFKTEIKGDLGAQLDRARIMQVLSNLIGNAVQHGALGTPITVTAWREGRQIKVAVHNEGAPILPSRMDAIFSAFVQGLEERKKNAESRSSLGLGLYIAKEIVTAHGGTLDVSSSAETGTTFLVSLAA